MNVRINDKVVEALEGETLLEIARREGYPIPSLCYAKDAKHKSSCMVCAVRNAITGQIIPACTTLPVEGMQIETDSPEVIRSRTLSLELLLSDHRADCDAPCQVACPGNMDVAAMNRLYDEGKTDEALTLLRDTLVIPATLCYICNAPCEKICRKGDIQAPVQIREIKKKLVAQTNLDKIIPPLVQNGKKIAVTGSDPAALAAAYYLCKQGYAVSLFEPSGEMLIPYIQAENVPPDILGLEMEIFRRMGIKLIHTSESPSPGDFDGIITPQTKVKQPARLVSEGQRLAKELHVSLSVGENMPTVSLKTFNSAYSRFTDKEKSRLAESPLAQTHCLYCDCNGKTSCLLRRYATEYGIRNTRYNKGGVREALNRQLIGENIRFEPAKCIRCGLCVYNSINGFTFKDRGFNMQVVLPEENVNNINEQLTRLCPTSALYCI
jgi:predicted molibdopterin-dependent oxidoreductase YjgC